MSTQTSIPQTDITLGGAETPKKGFEIETSYPFINEIKSPDNSVKVTGKIPVDLSAAVAADTSTGAVFGFEIDTTKENGAFINPGLQKFLLTAKENGIIIIDNEAVSVLPFPGKDAVLICNSENQFEWIPIPSASGDEDKPCDYALGTYGGKWCWYGVGACENENK